MRVHVTKSFLYSPHGWDVVKVPVGEQDLPDDQARLALGEGWATPVEPPANAPSDPSGEAALATEVSADVPAESSGEVAAPGEEPGDLPADPSGEAAKPKGRRR